VRDLVEDSAWDELYVSYTPEGGPTHRMFRQVAAECGGYLRVADYMEAWEISLEGDFESFLASLGSGTRARLMGSRKRLAEAGEVCERLLPADEMDAGWDIFGRLHESRWHRAFSDHWRRFYGTIAMAQAGQGVPVMSVLEFNGEPISLLVNFRAGRREYSMASAFVPVDVKRVSPGWLHLGLAIERAYADGMQVFDFLGGEGKNEQYKAAFGGHSMQLLCLQLLRRGRLKWLYRGWDDARKAPRAVARIQGMMPVGVDGPGPLRSEVDVGSHGGARGSVFRGIEGLEALRDDWSRLLERGAPGGYAVSYSCYEALLRYRHPQPERVRFFACTGRMASHSRFARLSPWSARSAAYPSIRGSFRGTLIDRPPSSSQIPACRRTGSCRCCCP
jgi:hypothetical protein